jgi:hypothetical protein
MAHSSWNSTVLLTLALALTLTLTLTLALAFLSSQKPPDMVLSGSMADVALHSMETCQKKNSWLNSVPVRPSNLSIAKLRRPHSGDSRASHVAAQLALAFDLEPRSSLHAFHTSKPYVTCVSIPLVLTLTSPAVVALNVCAVGRLALLKISSPTGFLAPLLPSQLWKALHADIAVALTTCWFSDKYFAASSRSTMVTWSSLLQPTTVRATSFTATWNCASASGITAVDPGSLGLAAIGRQWATLPISNSLPSCRSSWPRGRCWASQATQPARNLASLAREWRYGGTVKLRSNVMPRRLKVFVGLTSVPWGVPGGGGLALAANHHLCLGPVEREAVGLRVVNHDVDQTLQLLARLFVVLCHDPDRRVVSLAAVLVALPDLQGEGEV